MTEESKAVWELRHQIYTKEAGNHQALSSAAEAVISELASIRQCLVNTEKSLKEEGDRWVVAKEETDKVKSKLADCQRQLAAVTAELGAWKETADQMACNRNYYRGLVVKCGEHFGVAAKTQDDGGIVEDVLCAKVPELVAAVTAERNAAQAACGEMRQVLEQFDWEDACVTAFPSMAEWERALSTDYGKGWFHVSELEQPIALLDEWLKAEPGYGETIIRNVKARLEKLKGGKG